MITLLRTYPSMAPHITKPPCLVVGLQNFWYFYETPYYYTKNVTYVRNDTLSSLRLVYMTTKPPSLRKPFEPSAVPSLLVNIHSISIWSRVYI